MSSVYGKNIKLSIFGESHGEAIGATIDGLPPGFPIDFDDLENLMKKRQGGTLGTTQRKERDKVKILSGLKNGVTTGTPMTLMIKNENINSKSYENLKDKPRPGHGDFTQTVKFKGYSDTFGGGHFSGRLTAPLVAAGAIFLQLLKENNIKISSNIYSIGGVLNHTVEKGEYINKEIKEAIIKAQQDKDSFGGIIEAEITGLPIGLGEPIFDNIESKIAEIVFAIPGVKGIEFGSGFEGAKSKGSKNKDEFFLDDKLHLITGTNNGGGILGGIATGEPVTMKIAIKPTPSIGQPQRTVNLKTKKEEVIEIKGRHDTVIALRAMAVVEASLGIVIYDLLRELNR